VEFLRGYLSVAQPTASLNDSSVLTVLKKNLKLLSSDQDHNFMKGFVAVYIKNAKSATKKGWGKGS
jgi:hypothetical protein